MRVGNLAVVKGLRSLIVKVMRITEEDKAVVKVCGSGTELIIDLSDLEEIEAKQPERELEGVVHVLGTPYTVKVFSEGDYRDSIKADGWCDFSSKTIYLRDLVQDADSLEDLTFYQRKVCRHEIVHAFLFESGLHGGSFSVDCWAKSEEMVDWIAIQSTKLYKAFKEVGCEE